MATIKVMETSARRWSGWIAGLLVLVIFSVAAWGQSEETKPITLDEISKAALKQKSEIRTARVAMQHVNGLAKLQVTREMVQAAFDKLAQVERQGDEEALRNAVYETVAVVTGRKHAKWPELLLVQDGEIVRNRVSINGKTARDWSFRNGVSIHYWGNLEEAQITTGPPQQVLYNVSGIRPTIDPTLWKIVKTDIPKRIALEYADEETTASAWLDAESKILTKYTSDAFGGPYRIRGKIKSYPGDVAMPVFGIDLNMRGDLVRTFRAFLIEEAKFNVPLPMGELSSTVPANTRIHDKRNPALIVVGTAPSAGDPVELIDELLRTGKVRPRIATEQDGK